MGYRKFIIGFGIVVVILIITSFVMYKNVESPIASVANNESVAITPTTTGVDNAIGLRHYANEFYEFDYPENFSLTKEQVYRTHDKNFAGKDLFGMSALDFNLNGLVITVQSFNWLNADPVAPEESVTFRKEEFDKELHQIPSDTFEEISVGGLRGYRATYPFYEKGDVSRLGSLDVGLYGTAYTYSLNITWAPNDLPFSAVSFQKDATQFADIFIKSFNPK